MNRRDFLRRIAIAIVAAIAGAALARRLFPEPKSDYNEWNGSISDVNLYSTVHEIRPLTEMEWAAHFTDQKGRKWVGIVEAAP